MFRLKETGVQTLTYDACTYTSVEVAHGVRATRADAEDNEENQLQSWKIKSVRNPLTNKRMTLERARRHGIIDETQLCFVHPGKSHHKYIGERTEIILRI